MPSRVALRQGDIAGWFILIIESPPFRVDERNMNIWLQTGRKIRGKCGEAGATVGLKYEDLIQRIINPGFRNLATRRAA